MDITIASYTISQPKGGPLVDITIASYTVSQPKGGPLVDITAATYCIAAQGGTIGEHYRSHLLYHSPRGDHWWTLPQPLTVSQPKGGTIGGHHYSQLLYRSPRGDHWWTLPWPVTVSQPKGGPLVNTTAATYCITAQGGTIGGHYHGHLLYCSPRGDHWWTSR